MFSMSLMQNMDLKHQNFTCKVSLKGVRCARRLLKIDIFGNNSFARSRCRFLCFRGPWCRLPIVDVKMRNFTFRGSFDGLWDGCKQFTILEFTHLLVWSVAFYVGKVADAEYGQNFDASCSQYLNVLPSVKCQNFLIGPVYVASRHLSTCFLWLRVHSINSSLLHSHTGFDFRVKQVETDQKINGIRELVGECNTLEFTEQCDVGTIFLMDSFLSEIRHHRLIYLFLSITNTSTVDGSRS